MILKKKWSVLAMGSVALFLQQGSLLVALSQLSATRCVQVLPPTSHTSLDFFLTTFSFFPLSILQRRSGFTVLVGVGEDAVQCYICERFSTLLACIVSPSLLNHRFFIIADTAFYSDCSRPCPFFRLRHPLFLE